MRLFFAAWPPQAVGTALASWARGLSGRPVAAEKIHLTLAFLGSADPLAAAAAARRAVGIAHRLRIDTARYWKHNAIVWAGPRRTPPELLELAGSLKAELMHAGFALEQRAFAAHVTLVRKAAPPRSLPSPPSLDWPIAEFTLVNSTLSAEGSSYQVLERFPLQGAGSIG